MNEIKEISLDIIKLNLITLNNNRNMMNYYGDKQYKGENDENCFQITIKIFMIQQHMNNFNILFFNSNK